VGVLVLPWPDARTMPACARRRPCFFTEENRVEGLKLLLLIDPFSCVCSMKCVERDCWSCNPFVDYLILQDTTAELEVTYLQLRFV
jgi:hypothetical protein